MSKTRRLAEDNKFSCNTVTGKKEISAKLSSDGAEAKFCPFCKTYEQAIIGHDSKVHYYCNC